MAKYLTLIPLKFRVKDRPEGNMTRDDELQVLDMIVASQKSELFDKMEYSEFSNVSEIEDAYAEIAKGRLDMKYMIDGLVIEALEEEVRDALGYADDRPRFAVALKFPYIEKETEAVSLSWYTEGNTAIYTPVVNFKPVVLNGNTYQNTSIANYARFKELQLRKGDRVTFQLRNEVLGWIDKLETVGNENPLFKAPVKCEYCEAKLETDGVFLFCDNQECALVKLGNLQQFIDKLKIKGVQRATIEALVAAGLLENIPDFITLDYDAVANLEGFGIASARKLRDAIDGKLMIEGLKDWELLGSLNIPLVSTSRAKEILKHVSLQEMCIGPAESWKPRVMAIHGIKGKVANALAAGITKRHDTLTKMMSLVEGSSTKVKEVGAVEGPVYRVCITGALKRYKDRDDFKTAIEDKGHKCVSGVTKKTDFLVTNDTGSGTVKNQEAARLGIPILTEDQAIEKFGINKRPGKQVALKDVM
jgi:DNA ligase (NAD+)